MDPPIFFPIELYEYHTPNRRYYRLQAPIFLNPEITFLPHFLDIYQTQSNQEQITEWKKKWQFKQTLWGINEFYRNTFTRGYDFIYIIQNNESFPYETNRIQSYNKSETYRTNPKNRYQPTLFSYDQFGWGFSVYQIPDTTLGCFILDIYQSFQLDVKSVSILKDFILIREENEMDHWNDPYNFLPFQKNKNIPFYELLWSDKYIFGFFYEQEPKGTRWKMNASLLCYPTLEGKDSFPTISDCMNSYQQTSPFQSQYFQDPMIQIQKIGSESQTKGPNSTRSPWIWVYFTLLLLSLFILFLFRFIL